MLTNCCWKDLSGDYGDDANDDDDEGDGDGDDDDDGNDDGDYGDDGDQYDHLWCPHSWSDLSGQQPKLWEPATSRTNALNSGLKFVAQMQSTDGRFTKYTI